MSKHAILNDKNALREYFSDFIIILNGVAKAPPLNLLILQINGENIPARIALGVLNHQFLRRPCKEHFHKFKDSRTLDKEFNSVPEYGELRLTVEALCSWGIDQLSARN